THHVFFKDSAARSSGLNLGGAHSMLCKRTLGGGHDFCFLLWRLWRDRFGGGFRLRRCFGCGFGLRRRRFGRLFCRWLGLLFRFAILFKVSNYFPNLGGLAFLFENLAELSRLRGRQFYGCLLTLQRHDRLILLDRLSFSFEPVADFN